MFLSRRKRGRNVNLQQFHLRKRIAGFAKPTHNIAYGELGLSLDIDSADLIYQTRRDGSQDFYDVWLFHSDAQAVTLKLQPNEVIDAQWLSKEAICDLQKNEKLHPLINYLNLVFSSYES